MYCKSNQSSITPENFELPWSGKLSSDNRWAGLTSFWGDPRRQPLVIMAGLIPWSEFESKYAENFSETMGAIAKPFRMALAALIIKEKLGISDRETVEQIKENPYLQYFIGMSDYINDSPFEPSMMVYFRKRIDKNLLNQVNKKMVKNLREKTEKEQGIEKKRRSRS
jgi:hypothetical protein